ncbi:PepSY-associated TM helix domain-containing protein [Novosphingobium rosa]|uniref:PepSY-associated TM helix domain-containing protein n=1 Tax=Novosphingobium rosa TaxID=76978 RepID=UPI0009FE7669|nr:PepSY-associated TM helix domain-containing protein [Novosphingobium rosa]
MGRSNQTPKGGLYRPEIVRAVLSGHSVLGIAFAAVIYLVCLTGALSVFQQDFTLWEQPGLPRVERISDAAVVHAVAQLAPRVGEETLYVSFPDADMPRLRLTMDNGHEEHNWIADAQGRIVGEVDTPWTEFLTTLHIQLHLPRGWGGFIVGLTGVALLSSLISGILSHPRVLRDAFHLRLGGSRRLQEADWHNRLGVWPLPFHVLVSLTGALLGLSTIIVGALAMLLYRGDTQRVYALLLPPKPPVDARAAPLPDLGAMLATARAKAPLGDPHMMIITHAGRRDASVSLTQERPGLLATQDSFAFTANGRILQEKHPGGLTLGEQILGALGTLHFGWFGGVAVRIAYGLLGIALSAVTASGIHVWLARRRDKGRPAPQWERIWASILWGQPAILALTAALGVAAPAMIERMATGLWLGLTMASVIAAAVVTRVTDARIRALLRRMTGALLVVTALLHVARHGAHGDGIAMDAILATLGLCLTWSWRGKRMNDTAREASASVEPFASSAKG